MLMPSLAHEAGAAWLVCGSGNKTRFGALGFELPALAGPRK